MAPHAVAGPTPGTEQAPPAVASVCALDDDEVPVLRATLTMLGDRLREAGGDVLIGVHREAKGPGNVVKKCACHPVLLDVVEAVVGPNLALTGAVFARSAAAGAAAAPAPAKGAAGWLDADGRFMLDGAAAAPSSAADAAGVRLLFGDASAGAAAGAGAFLVRGLTGEEDAADERVVKRLKVAQYHRMTESTDDDLTVQCAMFNMDKRKNQADRVMRMLTQLKGLDVGTKVDLYEHSVQTAARALADGRDEEYVVCALLHDIGELLCPNAHGELPASLLRPYISPRMWWVLAHHEVFQAYYYLDHCGGDKHARERFRYHKYFHACEEFCYKYDQASFDPDYKLPDVDKVFAPMVRRVLSREPYWHLGHLETPMCEAKDAIAKGYT